MRSLSGRLGEREGGLGRPQPAEPACYASAREMDGDMPVCGLCWGQALEVGGSGGDGEGQCAGSPSMALGVRRPPSRDPRICAQQRVPGEGGVAGWRDGEVSACGLATHRGRRGAGWGPKT